MLLSEYDSANSGNNCASKSGYGSRDLGVLRHYPRNRSSESCPKAVSDGEDEYKRNGDGQDASQMFHSRRLQFTVGQIAAPLSRGSD